MGAAMSSATLPCLVVLRLLHVDSDAKLPTARDCGCHQVEDLLQLWHPA